MFSQTELIATINKVEILVIVNGQKVMPINPICEAFGIDEKAQRAKIQNDEILSSVGVLSTNLEAMKRAMKCSALLTSIFSAGSFPSTQEM